MNDNVNLDNDFDGDLENAASTVAVSAELAALSNSATDAEIVENQGQVAEQAKKSESALKFARKIAAGAISGLDSALDMFLQCNTGLTAAERAEFCEGFAPMLVRMGVTDYKSFLDGYGCYVMAAVAVFKLGLRVSRNVGQQLADKLAEQDEQPVRGYQQDFTGKGV